MQRTWDRIARGRTETSCRHWQMPSPGHVTPAPCYSIHTAQSSDMYWLTTVRFRLAFSALTLLAGRQEEHPACKNWLMRCWCGYWRQEEHPACKNWVTRCWCGYLSGAKCRSFAYGPADAAASPNPIILKSRLVLPFWYWLTQVVLEKRLWNGCSSNSS